jgi:hypothetical protein
MREIATNRARRGERCMLNSFLRGREDQENGMPASALHSARMKAFAGITRQGSWLTPKMPLSVVHSCKVILPLELLAADDL